MSVVFESELNGLFMNPPVMDAAIGADEWLLLNLDEEKYCPSFNGSMILIKAYRKNGTPVFSAHSYTREAMLECLEVLASSEASAELLMEYTLGGNLFLVENPEKNISKSFYLSPLMMALYLREYDLARKLIDRGYTVQGNSENHILTWGRAFVDEEDDSPSGVYIINDYIDLNNETPIEKRYNTCYRIISEADEVSALELILSDADFPEDIANQIDSMVMDFEINVKEDCGLFDIVRIYASAAYRILGTLDSKKIKGKMLPLKKFADYFPGTWEIGVDFDALRTPLFTPMYSSFIKNNTYKHRIQEFMLWNNLMYEYAMLMVEDEDLLDDYLCSLNLTYERKGLNESIQNSRVNNYTGLADKSDIKMIEGVLGNLPFHVKSADAHKPLHEALCKRRAHVCRAIKNPYQKEMYIWIVMKQLLANLWYDSPHSEENYEVSIEYFSNLFGRILKSYKPEVDTLLLDIMCDERWRFSLDKYEYYRLNSEIYFYVMYTLMQIYTLIYKRRIVFPKSDNLYEFLYFYFHSSKGGRGLVEFAGNSGPKDFYDKFDVCGLDISMMDEDSRSVYSTMLAEVLRFDDIEILTELINKGIIIKSTLDICKQGAIENGWFNVVPFLIAMGG